MDSWCILPPSNRKGYIFNPVRVCVGLFVYMLATLPKNESMDFREIFKI